MASTRIRWLPRPAFVSALSAPLALLGSFLAACANEEGHPRATPSITQEVNVKTVIIPIEGMSCSACAARVKKMLTSMAGVSNVEVNLAQRNARIQFAPGKLSAAQLVAAINGLGYQASAPAEAK